MDVAVTAVFATAIVAPWLVRRLGRHSGWILALSPLAITVYLLGLAPRVAGGAVLSLRRAWAPGLDVSASFRLDGLSLLLGLLVVGIGTLVVIYAGGYLSDTPQRDRFFALLFLFMGSMLGLVLADNLLLLFIFWELTSLASYLLIGFKHDQAKARKAALQALLVTGSGGLALLAGLVLLAQVGGSWELSALLDQGARVQADPRFPLLLALILLGAFTKSAQFPFHFWLPNAMAAPTPVSAYLHSATMVKAGVYLLARLHPTLAGGPTWSVTLTLVGALTAFVGAWLAWQKRDLKQILAYSTISALGTLVLLLGVGTPTALKTAMLFLLVHALYKGALFMTAGTIEHETGSRDLGDLGGLARAMPLTLAGVALGALSMAGLPPLPGFLSKEYLYETTLAAGPWAAALTGAAWLTNVLLVVAAAVLIARPFRGSRRPAERPVHEGPPSLWLGPLVLGALALASGALIGPLADGLLAPAAGSVAGAPFKVSFAWWSGLTPMLALSALTVAAGLGAYAAYDRARTAAGRLDALSARLGPARAYEASLDGLQALAREQTRLIQSGYLRTYVKWVLVFLLLLVGGALLGGRAVVLARPTVPAQPHEVALAVVIVAATLLAVTSRSRLTAVAALGVVGFALALFYVFFNAPDLAMTQFAVETLTVILFVLVLYRLPRFTQLTSVATRRRDAALAVTVGLLMAALVLTVTASPIETRLTPYFAANSLALAKGRNIVNVILVDFRGLDTIGEITVLAVAAIGVFALIRAGRRRRASADATEATS